ncbi:MAG: hypothetical protein AAFR68_16665 [Pseudomonadota bacterium]
MTFREFLKKRGENMSAFGRRVGELPGRKPLSPNYLSEIAAGRKLPSLTTAGDIYVATDFKVPVTYWLVLSGQLEPDPAHEISL